MLKSNKLLFSALVHVPGNPVSSGAKGRGEGSRICTKLLLSHKAAKPHSLLIATGDWLRLQKYKWLPECKWQTSKAARSMCWFYIFQRRAWIQSGRVEQGLWKSYLCPEVKAGSAVPAGLSAAIPTPSLGTCLLPFTACPHRQNTYCIFQLTCEVIPSHALSPTYTNFASLCQREMPCTVLAATLSKAQLYPDHKKVIQTCAHFNCKWSCWKFS